LHLTARRPAFASRNRTAGTKYKREIESVVSLSISPIISNSYFPPPNAAPVYKRFIIATPLQRVVSDIQKIYYSHAASARG